MSPALPFTTMPPVLHQLKRTTSTPRHRNLCVAGFELGGQRNWTPAASIGAAKPNLSPRRDARNHLSVCLI